jgi:TP901 family phage tail tape measure protein
MNLERMAAVSPKAFSTNAVQQSVAALRSLEAGYRAGTVSQLKWDEAIQRVNVDLAKQNAAINSVNKQGMTLGNMFELAAKKVMIWFGATTLIYGSLMELRKATTYIKDLNKEMTNIQLVTGESSANIGNLANQFNQLATEMATTTLKVAEGALTWQRAGYSAADSMLLLRASTTQAVLGNMDAADSTDKLIATLHGFGLEAKDAMGIVDKLVNLDNNYASSVKEISGAMTYASSIASGAGVSFDQLASYVTILSSTTRMSAETIGTALKTILTRFTNVKAGASLDEFGDSLNNVEKVLRTVDIQIRDSTDSFKPMGSVINEVASKWTTFTDVQQAQIATAIAGVRQQNLFMAKLLP